jgi:hypothetical protein
MRLWTLHPRHLDPKGLVALWREGLLARAVLRDATTGYRRHPQLERFRAAARPLDTLDAYLHAVCDEAGARGYRFDRAKLGALVPVPPLDATRGQLDFEWRHLLAKLAVRAPELHARWRAVVPDAHPLFRIVEDDGVAPWERAGR